MANLDFNIDYFQNILQIYNNSKINNIVKIKYLIYLYKDLISSIISKQNQYFSSNFAKIVFIIDKYQLPESLGIDLKNIRKLKLNSLKEMNKNKLDNYLFSIINTIALLVSYIYNINIPDELLIIINKNKKIPNKFSFVNIPIQIDFLRVTVLQKGYYEQDIENNKIRAAIICESEKYGKLTIQLNTKWSNTRNLVWKGAVINIFNSEKISSKEVIIKLTQYSYLVIEPDYLIDVTELSECFLQNNYNVYYFFLKRFISKQSSKQMVAGNLVNYCFDEIINNPEIDFDTAWNNSIKAKPLQLFSLAVEGKKNNDKLIIQDIKNKVSTQFYILKDIIKTIEADSITTEASFISPKYGLQGRLDLFIEFNNDINRKTIIELKSGKAPAINYSYRNDEGIVINTGVWNNHLAQITYYNLLLDSTFSNRSGDSQILYAGAVSDFNSQQIYHLRNVPNIIQKKQEVIAFRNLVIALEYRLMAGRTNILNSITKEKFGNCPKYSEADLYLFENTYQNSNEFEKAYFHVFLSFIMREIHSSKISNNNSNHSRGFSGLWQDSLQDKIESLNIISGLVLDKDNSDFINFYLHFNFNSGSTVNYSMRKGDIAILYPYNNKDDYNPINNQIIKCVIKYIDSEKVIISIRNKQFHKEFLSNYSLWILEPDYIENSNKILYLSLFEFLASKKQKKDLLFGITQPEFEQLPLIYDKELSDYQNKLLNQALSAKNYFLLQGPPGTGKTSFMLKSIVKHIFNSTNDDILVLAYTNRAVDEICSAIVSISEELPFLRLGSKESSAYPEYLISCLTDTLPFGDVYKKLLRTRVIVATVSSALTNSEIFYIKNFKIAIIDESTQILEPQIIGILTKVDKFIMIGDEKQLPAVVVQPQEKLFIESEILKPLHFNRLDNSIFERLISNAKANNWHDAYGMLYKQARMHKDLQLFPSINFYNNELEIFEDNEWQTTNIIPFRIDSDNIYERIISSSRLIFIDTPAESYPKINKNEAKLCSEFVNIIYNSYGNSFTNETLGIISPFRAQCAEISNSIPHSIRSLIAVDTVERFQGSERDIILISYCMNYSYLLNSVQSLTIIDDIVIDRKLNVALTRAKKHLVIMGNSTILSQSEVFKKLIDYIVYNGKYYNIEEIYNSTFLPI